MSFPVADPIGNTFDPNGTGLRDTLEKDFQKSAELDMMPS